MKRKKIISLALCFLMTLSILTGGTSLVEAEGSTTESGISETQSTEPQDLMDTLQDEYVIDTDAQTCTHVHDETCGYVASTQEIPCVNSCVDVNGDGVVDHRENCTYQAAHEEIPCDKECIDIDRDGVIDHVEDCSYQPAIEEISCDATCIDVDGDGIIDHSETCTYQPAQEGSPCTHVHDETCGAVLPETIEIIETQAPTINQIFINDWTWPENIIKQFEWSDDGWVLSLTGYNIENPLLLDELRGLLPNEIVATLDNDEVIPVAISWDFSNIPVDGLFEGVINISATLADTNYSLTADALSLMVRLEFNQVMPMLSIPSNEPPYSEHFEYGVSPSGTKIDLFDYWISEQNDSDNTNPNDFINNGINKGHALLFGRGMNDFELRIGDWNYWTGNESPRGGIVGNRLVNGYPVLSVDLDQNVDEVFRNGRAEDESLDYLFDPNTQVDGKASYPDVKGLLQIDALGYYYYDSKENYAVYYPENKAFTLYDLPGVYAGGTSPNGQFFPFNVATSNGSKGMMNQSSSNDSSINHYFGIHMSTRFIQQNGGMATTGDDLPVTYSFSGDDDVWIFIDDVLVVDLGGIHDAASTEINFSNGEIKINGVVQSQTLGDLLELESNTLPDNTYHTLDFFYLERGNVDSNMYLKYNLVTIPESSVIKIDQMGTPVEGAEFSLYTANDQGKPDVFIAKGITDSSGEFVFLDNENIPITIQQLYDTYYDEDKVFDPNNIVNDLVLVETVTPAGYRTVEPTGLYFFKTDNGEILLLSNSMWDQGAYAMSKVTTTAQNQIMLEDGTKITLDDEWTGGDSENIPLLFAVVFQKQDYLDENNNDVWLPVYGDPIKGWTVCSSNTWTDVLTAARNNPYVFKLASSGAYQVEVNNLPGDIKTYYHVVSNNKSNAKYTVGYYYSTASSLQDATQNNTRRIDGDPEDKTYDLNRVFSVDLYVANIKNNLIVQKVDENNVPVNGAEFALYNADQVEIIDGQLVPNKNVIPYKTLITDSIQSPLVLDGGGVFDGLNIGEYYLVEIDVPKGYKINSTPIHVVVDNTGVYANAGNDYDGISVLKGAGSIVRSMLQFATDDKVNNTLSDIKVTLADNVNYVTTESGTSNFQWDEPDWNDEGTLHLQFTNNNSLLDYGLYNNVPGTLDNLTLCTQSGWSRLLVRQCYDHTNDNGQTVDTSLKENLGTKDITKLFSTTTTVRVENQRTGDIRLTKIVTGDNAPDVEFKFKVSLSSGISGTFAASKVEQNTPIVISLSFNNGRLTHVNGEEKDYIELMNGENITIFDIPVGTVFTIEEIDIPAGFKSTASLIGTNASTPTGSVISGNVTHTTDSVDPVIIEFTNEFDGNVRVTLSGNKTLLGRPYYANESYHFSLHAYDDNTKAAISSGKIIIPNYETTLENIDGNIADFFFRDITFKDVGEYSFYITEVLPGIIADDESLPIYDGVWYDENLVSVKIRISRNTSTNILEASIDYSNENGEKIDLAAFSNYWASLALSKTVTGNMGDRDAEFIFEIELNDKNNIPISGVYKYVIDSNDGANSSDIIEFKDGIGYVNLKHGQRITFYGLPIGAQYIISEPNAAADGYKTVVDVDSTREETNEISGTLSVSQTVEIEFTNTRNNDVPPTGLNLDNWPLLLCMGLSFGVIIALQVVPKRRRTRRYRTRH